MIATCRRWTASTVASTVETPESHLVEDWGPAALHLTSGRLGYYASLINCFNVAW